jgi:hypothetical protein
MFTLQSIQSLRQHTVDKGWNSDHGFAIKTFPTLQAAQDYLTANPNLKSDEGRDQTDIRIVGAFVLEVP